jgi:hypothetical protein
MLVTFKIKIFHPIITNFHTKFHMPSYNVSLVIIIKLKDK